MKEQRRVSRNGVPNANRPPAIRPNTCVLAGRGPCASDCGAIAMRPESEVQEPPMPGEHGFARLQRTGGSARTTRWPGRPLQLKVAPACKSAMALPAAASGVDIATSCARDAMPASLSVGRATSSYAKPPIHSRSPRCRLTIRTAPAGFLVRRAV